MESNNGSAAQSSSATGQASVGPAPMVDLNHNGIPDYEEGWFWRTLYEVGRALVVVFAGEKTRARAAVDYIDAQTGRAKP